MSIFKLYPLKPIEKNEDEKPKFDHNEYNEKRSSTLELIQLQREIFHSKFSIQTKRGVIVEKLKLKSMIAEKKVIFLISRNKYNFFPL